MGARLGAVAVLIAALLTGAFVGTAGADAAGNSGGVTTVSQGILANQIRAGPDVALWFTNGGNTIGRVTTSGVVTNNFTDPSIDNPQGIPAGPDGALWCGSPMPWVTVSAGSRPRES